MIRLSKNSLAVLSALFSAFLYALCIPVLKAMSVKLEPIFTGAFLYLGAGAGLFLTMFVQRTKPELKPAKKDFPYITGMILLDIFAIIFLTTGISLTTAANASLLGNFELVATTVLAKCFFGEKVSYRMFIAILFITAACVLLTFENADSFVLNRGSLLVLLSCLCWGAENNCTRMLSENDTRIITVIKGLFSGVGSIFIAIILNEQLPQLKWIVLIMILGFVSYGISVCLYIYAQRFLKAAKTGAFFSTAPFIGVILSLIFLQEHPAINFYVAMLIMLWGVYLVIVDNKKNGGIKPEAA